MDVKWSCAYKFFDASALINIKTNSFIFFVNANERWERAADGRVGGAAVRLFIIFVVFSSKAIISSGPECFLGKKRRCECRPIDTH